MLAGDTHVEYQLAHWRNLQTMSVKQDSMIQGTPAVHAFNVLDICFKYAS